MSSADFTIYTPGIGTLSYTVSSTLGRIQRIQRIYHSGCLVYADLVEIMKLFCKLVQSIVLHAQLLHIHNIIKVQNITTNMQMIRERNNVL